MQKKTDRFTLTISLLTLGLLLSFLTPNILFATPVLTPYFGDIHVHTSYDIDSRMGGNTNDPDTAYRFAKGEISIPIDQALNPSPKIELKISKPLDFAAVTDHAEMMAIDLLCLDSSNLKKYPNIYNSKSCQGIRSYNVSSFFTEEKELLKARPQLPEDICPSSQLSKDPNPICLDATKARWLELQKIANKHYKKGIFTTFISYEHTPTTSTQGAFHRNILFRGSSVPDMPISAYDIFTSSALWKKLDETCNKTNNCQALVIPHMVNVSNGMFFAKNDRVDSSQTPPKQYTPEDYERRKRLEPLIEIHQTKGNSECLYGAGTEDKLCQFESKIMRPCDKFDTKNYPDVNCREDSYVRNGLKKGLLLAEEKPFNGINPFEYGFVGGTDNQHGAPGSVEEYDYVSVGGLAGVSAKGRLTQEPKKPGKAPLRFLNPGGLTGVWAEENSREAIFDALQRKEVFATSGTRISVRLFASWNYPKELTQFSQKEMIERAYQDGVPMGGELQQNALVQESMKSPIFLVLAKKDPDGANLQRLQVIKGWMDFSGVHERVYDIASLNNETNINLADCSVSGLNGVTEFSMMWKDPHFNPQQRAFYYIRVLENPTCRWSTYDANRLGITPKEDIPSTIQERAWSSPIWYIPL